MKILALFLLVSGWIIVLAATILLSPGWKIVFVLGGVGVQLAGVVLLFRAHLLERRRGDRSQ